MDENKRVNAAKLPELVRLQAVLTHLNMTVADIAEMTGVAERTILNYRWNNAPIGGVLLRRLHECFGVSVDWLLSGSGEMFLDSPLMDKHRPLIPDFEHTDIRTVKDCLWLSARAIEQSMIECGAVPGQDYSIGDLYKMAIPFAAIRFEKADAELCVSTEF